MLAGQQLHQLRQRCKEISEKFNTYENSSNCQDIHCKCDDTAGKPYRTKLILFTGLLSCTLWIKKNWEFVHRYNQEQNCWKTLKKKLPFLLQIAASHRSVRHNTDLPPPFHSKLFLQACEHGLVLLATVIRGGGGTWTGQNTKNTIVCVSSFATGCSARWWG